MKSDEDSLPLLSALIDMEKAGVVRDIKVEETVEPDGSHRIAITYIYIPPIALHQIDLII